MNDCIVKNERDGDVRVYLNNMKVENKNNLFNKEAISLINNNQSENKKLNILKEYQLNQKNNQSIIKTNKLESEVNGIKFKEPNKFRINESLENFLNLDLSILNKTISIPNNKEALKKSYEDLLEK